MDNQFNSDIYSKSEIESEIPDGISSENESESGIPIPSLPAESDPHPDSIGLIAISGATCSGKSTLARALLQKLKELVPDRFPSLANISASESAKYEHMESSLSLTAFDDFYHDRKGCPITTLNIDSKPYTVTNWEHPSCIKWESYLNSLKSRNHQMIHITEGFLLPHSNEVLNQCSLIIHLDATSELIYNRRLARATPPGPWDGPEVYLVSEGTHNISSPSEIVFPQSFSNPPPNWFKCYFDSIIWPQADTCSKIIHNLLDSPFNVPILILDANSSIEDLVSSIVQMLDFMFINWKGKETETSALDST